MTAAPTAPVRYVWVDLAKCVSILLVISYHCPPRYDGYLFDILRLLRMPAFFMIAGFLFNYPKFPTFGAFLRHRGVRLLVPYTSFFLIFYPLWLFVARPLLGGDDLAASPLQPLFDFLWGGPTLVVAPYWFICCLFSMQLLHYLLRRYLPLPLLVPVILLLPLLHSLPFSSRLPWNLSRAFLYLPYYALPNLLKAPVRRLGLPHLPLILPMLIVSLVLIRHISSFSGILRDYLSLLSGMLLLPAYILLIKQLSRLPIGRFARFIGGNTIIILALQNYIIGALLLLPFSLALPPLLHNLLFALLVLFLTIPFILLINRRFPALIGRGARFSALLSSTRI